MDGATIETHTPKGYIDLSRRFRALSDQGGIEEATAASYLLDTLDGSTLGWDELLEKNLVVVLGEPGSGKSWEFRHRCDSLLNAGMPAFLIELERLVSGTLASGFSPTQQSRFQKWLKGKSNAYFFLDSVDEAKIRRHTDFYTALEKVANAIGYDALGRVHIILSSRISEWQPETDLNEVLLRFGSAGSVDPSVEEPLALIVQITPLNRDRVRKFAVAKGIENAERFVDELDNRSAWEFARRPLDVVDLAEFWSAIGRLGTLTEIIEHDVTRKLKETAQRSSTFPLSEGRAREGAEALAIATILCKKQQFKVPDDSYPASGALDASICLPTDWKPVEIAALLSRPLFDSATYGQIRFHHRRVSEYLAACWYRCRMNEGCPAYVLNQQLFEEVSGKPVPRRSLVPVIAWLCAGDKTWNEEVRAKVLGGAPGIHLEYGDPEQLPIEYKRRLLVAWINLNKDRDEVWIRYSSDMLRRLAEPQLVPDIAGYLSSSETSAQIRELLVHLVRHGKLVDCIPNLLEILSNSAESADVKVYAMAALRDMGTAESHQLAWDILRRLPALPRSMRSVACETLYPNTIGADGLAVLLEIPCSEKENNGHLKHILQTHLEECLTIELADSLTGELNRLVQLSPHISMSGKKTRISDRFDFLLDIFPTVLNKVLNLTILTEEQCDKVAESLSLLAEAHPFNQSQTDNLLSIGTMTHSHPNLRRCFFWRTFERLRDTQGEPPSQFFLMHDFRLITNVTEFDVDWMLEDLAALVKLADRKLLFTIILRHAPQQFKKRLDEAASLDSALTKMLNEDRYYARWGWTYRIRDRWGRAIEWKFWVRGKQRALAIKWNAICYWFSLQWNCRRLASGRPIIALSNLCREASSDNHRHTPKDWNTLTEKRGRRVSNAVKAGCKRAWRNYSPLVPHEKSRPNTYGCELNVGLVGIQSAITDGELIFAATTEDEVKLMARYAIGEMNGFPDWFSQLAISRPKPLSDLFGACVRGEWLYPANREHAYDVLAKLAWKGKTLALLARPAVIDRLGAGDPVNTEIRQAAVSLVLKTTTLPDDELEQIAISRCSTLPVDSGAYALWMAICLQVDAANAITLLERHLPACATADQIVINICHLLGGDSRREMPVIAQADFLKVAALERLIPLIHRHIRRSEDSDHSDGEPFSSTRRDEAANFRGGLLNILANSESSKAIESLRRLANHPDLFTSRDRILHLIDERMISEADSVTWLPSAIRAFASERVWAKLRPDIVLVAVNQHETREVLDAFKSATGVDAVPLSIEDRIYLDLGMLNNTRVLLAKSEMGSGGVGAMQQTVDRAIRALDPGAVIAIGIAFGVNEKRQDVGDILVSKQLRPYELQRVGVSAIVLRSPRPDASQRLVNHFEFFAQSKWNGAPIRFGLILSGEKLIDSVDYRNQLTFESEAIGGEMEGVGLYASGQDHKVDWIILKAICDFADGQKGQNKEQRQKLAAQNAAQFLIESLQFAPLKRES